MSVTHKKNKNLSIVFIINSLATGGAERVMVDEINELVKRGASVFLVTFARPKNDFLEKELMLPKEQQKIIAFTGFWNLRSWRELIVFLRTTKPDMLVTSLWFANTVGRVAARLAKVPMVLTFEQNVYDGVKTKKMFLADRLLQRFSTKIVAVSEAVRASLIRHGIAEEKVIVVENAFSRSRFLKKAVDPVGFRDATVGFIFIFVGRLIHQKAVDVLIKAFAKFNEKGEKAPTLLVVGDGPDRAALESLCAELGVQDAVRFLGIRSDVPELLSRADCFVFPSRYEGLPLAWLEAVAAGLPIIVTNFDAVQGIVRSGENGLVVPIDDVDALTAAMKKLMADRELRAHLVAGSKSILERFSIERHVDRLLELNKG